MFVKYSSFFLLFFLSFTGFSQQLNRFVLQDWNGNDWENRMQQLPFYNAEGRLIKRVNAHWNAEMNDWEDKSKMEFVRDDNGAVLRREEFNWIEDQAAWEAALRMNYTVNEQSKPISVLTEMKSGDGWYNTRVDEYTYDSNGKMTEKRSEKWDKQLKAWVPYQKFSYTIESDLTQGYVIFYWDRKQNNWELYKKAEYRYTKDDNIDHISFGVWKDGEWQVHSVRKNVHDDQGAIEEREVDIFNETTNTWDHSTHTDFEMNDFGKVSEVLSKKWNSDQADWDKLQRLHYYYTKENETQEERSPVTDEMELFPNPTDQQLTIRSIPSGKMVILDALGKVIYENQNNKTQLELDVSEWEMGVYTVQVNGAEIESFVKQ